MPILAAEPNIYPSDLLKLGRADSNAAGARSWWLFYTRARQEKSLARDLFQRQIHFYLPLVASQVMVHGRPAQSYVPLLPGYLFVFAAPEDRARALMTKRVVQVLPIEDQSQIEVDLRNIQRLIGTGEPLVAEMRPQSSLRARVRAGGLQGLEGTVIKRGNQSRLVVWVAMLQQGVSLDMQDVLLEQI